MGLNHYLVGKTTAIGVCAKVGSGTLAELKSNYHKIFDKKDIEFDDQKYEKIILYRNPLEKYISGYMEDFMMMLKDNIGHYVIHRIGDCLQNETFDITGEIKDLIIYTHDIKNILNRSRFNGIPQDGKYTHTNISSLNSYNTTYGELYCLSETNPSYKFLHLQHLSSQSFLDYLRNNDSTWDNVEKMGHQNFIPQHDDRSKAMQVIEKVLLEYTGPKVLWSPLLIKVNDPNLNNRFKYYFPITYQTLKNTMNTYIIMNDRSKNKNLLHFNLKEPEDKNY